MAKSDKNDPKEPKEPTTRVVQIWPEALKEKLQEEVGQRGLTRYTLEAVNEKWDREHPETEDGAEPNGEQGSGGAKDFPTDPFNQDPVPARVPTQPVTVRKAPERDSGGPAFLEPTKAEREAAEERKMPLPPEPRPTGPLVGAPVEMEPVDKGSGFFDAIQRKAGEMGIAVTKASDLPTPEGVQAAPVPAEEEIREDHQPGQVVAEPESEPSGPERMANLPRPEDLPQVVLDEDKEEPAQESSTPEAAVADPDVCPKCGDPLIDGECWSCG